MRDYLSPCEIVVSQEYIPEVFEETYGLSFPKSSISGRRLPLNAHSLLQAYSLKRGYMGENHSGPDEARGSRYILKDFVAGKNFMVLSSSRDATDVAYGGTES